MAEVLQNEGNDVVVANAADRPDPSGFDAYVIGSGVQIGSWHKEGNEFLERNQATLAGKPAWLFSSRPLPGSSMKKETEDRLELALGPLEGPAAAAESGSKCSRRRSIRARTASSMAHSIRRIHRSRCRSGWFA
jgi:menaquinone-dependent protoporphyrinogen oxidase